MLYLLETNAISDLMRKDPAVEPWSATLLDDDRVITCVTAVGEILFGIEKLVPGRHRSQLEQLFRTVRSALPCESIPEAAAEAYARIKSDRRRGGLPLDESDLWIASTALVLGAALVTRDSDFNGIADLRLIIPGSFTAG